MLNALLAHPLTRGLDLDDPRTTELRRRIIQDKSFLRRIYSEWYSTLASDLSVGTGPVLELGSGAGFLKQFVPDVITSEVFSCPGAQVVLSGLELPFKSSSLRAIVMVDVLHHLPRVRQFFCEAQRCTKPDGIIAMIEPWVSPWSKLIYAHLHHEPFAPGADRWEFPNTGPLSGANGALPFIIFSRDREQFEREFPLWDIRTLEPIMPFRYLVSGGISMRSLMPGWSFGWWRGLENLLRPLIGDQAMFAHIVLKKRK